MFNDVFKEFQFTYVTGKKNENIIISLKLLNKGKYNIIIFINNEQIKSKDIISNSTIKLKPKVLNDICKFGQQVCIISFNILTSENEFSLLKITINPLDDYEDIDDEDEEEDENENENGKNSNYNKDDNSGSNTVLIIVIIIIGLILITGGVFIFLKYRKKYHLKEEVEKINKDKERLLY